MRKLLAFVYAQSRAVARALPTVFFFTSAFGGPRSSVLCGVVIGYRCHPAAARRPLTGWTVISTPHATSSNETASKFTTQKIVMYHQKFKSDCQVKVLVHGVSVSESAQPAILADSFYVHLSTRTSRLRRHRYLADLVSTQVSYW